MYRSFIVSLIVVGLLAALIGTLGPVGGGPTLVSLGSAAFGAGLVLIGLGLRSPNS